MPRPLQHLRPKQPLPRPGAAAPTLNSQPSTLNRRASPFTPGLQPCPGLTKGVFTDTMGRRHDLAREPRLTPKSAAGTHGLPATVRGVLTLIRAGQLYPVLRPNARTVEIYACALTDYWTRLSSPRAIDRYLRTA